MLAELARPSRQASVSWNPLDARWYQSINAMGNSDAGITVVPERALSIAVVFRAINVRAHALASIPLVVYKRLDNDGKERAREHPQYDLLHDRPNAWSTSFRWRHLMQVQRIIWGNHYSEIMPGLGGVGQLVPLSPVTTRLVDQLPDGRLLYVTRDVTGRGYGPERRLLQDEILHVRGFSIDGKSGLPLPQLARNAMGLALAAERHGSMFLKKGARFSGVLSAPGRMDDETRKANEAAWQRAYGGSDATGGTPLMSGDMKYTPISADNRNSQWIESRTFQVEELLRFLEVPGVLCGYADKTSTYASAEQFFISFVTNTVRVDTTMVAEEITQSVVVGAPEYYADFILEGLLKGDIKTRYDAYRIGIGAGFLNRNEVRVKEDMNRGPKALDTFLEPLNMIEAGEERDEGANGPPRRTDPPRRDDEDDEEDSDEDEERTARLAAIAERAVTRLVRKEVRAIVGGPGQLGAAKRFADNASGWGAWMESFYEGHASLVADELGVPAAAAVRYTTAQRERLKAGVPDNFESASIGAMLALLEG